MRRSQLKRFIPQSALLSSAALAVAHRGATVFMLHRVLPPTTASYDAEMVTSTDLFGDLVQWLAKEFQIVTLQEVAERLRSGRSLRRLCALTFDDGWLDNYTHALPILRQVGAPATIFVVSRFIGGMRRLWQEKLWFLLKGISESQVQTFVREWRAGSGIELFPDDSDFAKWRSFLIGLGSARAENFVDALQLTAPPASVPEERTFMNWDEVREMQRAGIEFGAHTLNHVLLTTVPSDIVRSEIEGSRHDIESELNTGITGFAYPWGACNAFVRESVQEAGFSYAAGVSSGLVVSKSDPLLLPRIFMGDSVLGEGIGFSGTNMAVHVAFKSVVPEAASQY